MLKNLFIYIKFMKAKKHILRKDMLLIISNIL